MPTKRLVVQFLIWGIPEGGQVHCHVFVGIMLVFLGASCLSCLLLVSQVFLWAMLFFILRIPQKMVALIKLLLWVATLELCIMDLFLKRFAYFLILQAIKSILFRDSHALTMLLSARLFLVRQRLASHSMVLLFKVILVTFRAHIRH